MVSNSSVQMSTTDAGRSGRYAERINFEIIIKILDQLIDHKKLNVNEITSAVSISNDWVQDI